MHHLAIAAKCYPGSNHTELERVARARGLRFVKLHVFSRRTMAHQLYEELGFESISITLRKPLP